MESNYGFVLLLAGAAAIGWLAYKAFFNPKRTGDDEADGQAGDEPQRFSSVPKPSSRIPAVRAAETAVIQPHEIGQLASPAPSILVDQTELANAVEARKEAETRLAVASKVNAELEIRLKDLNLELEQSQWFVEQQAAELDLRLPPDDIVRMLSHNPMSATDIKSRLDIGDDELRTRTKFLMATGQITQEGSTDPGNAIFSWNGPRTSPHRPNAERNQS